MKEISDSSILNFDFNRNFCSTLKRYVERASTTRGGFGMGFFGDPQFPWKGLFEIWGFLSPRIEDFFLSGDFYPRDWGFLKSWNFYSRELGSLSPGSLSPGFPKSPGFFGDGDFSRKVFFSWDGISHQKATSAPRLTLLWIYHVSSIIWIFHLWIHGKY